MKQKSMAWMIHLYTALGGVLGVYALMLVADDMVRQAFILLLITTLIDATDGLLARRVGVKQVLPHFDGAQVDNVIDVLTYVWIPVFIMIRQELIPHIIWLTVPVLAAMYAYGQTNMKTSDSYFLGFPSYWNVVALYLFWLKPIPPIAVLIIVIPAILTFIPTRYLYPSRNRVLWKTTWGLGFVWIIMLSYMLSQDTPNQNLILISLFYPFYYTLASFYVDWRIRRKEVKSV